MPFLTVELELEDVEEGFWEEDVKPLLKSLKDMYGIDVTDWNGNEVWNWEKWTGEEEIKEYYKEDSR